jgi:hypothetical protein
MEAKVQYNDFKGTVAADIDDHLGKTGDNLESIGKYLKVNEDRFKVVGLSIHGTENQYISLVCVDKEKSTADKEHIVNMSYDIEESGITLDHLFKRLHIVLYDRHDGHYPHLDYTEEVNYSEYHDTNED